MSNDLAKTINTYLNINKCEDGYFLTSMPAFGLMRFAHGAPPQHMIYKPALCIVVQGEKHARFGERLFSCKPMQALLIGVEIPVFSDVRQASVRKPFLGAMIELDLPVLREVIDQLGTGPLTKVADFGVLTVHLQNELADCIERLALLLLTPKALSVLYASVMREICYWLVTGPSGAEICNMALLDGHTQRITKAITVLRNSFNQPIRVQELADAASMSLSTFYQHFKTLTGISPLQYQKQLRLLEARRLMMEGTTNVETAAYQVGYESASQFSREYARHFGTPPKRDQIHKRNP